MTCNTLRKAWQRRITRMEEETLFKPLTKVLIIGVLLAPASALAVPITVDFTITSSSAGRQRLGATLQRLRGRRHDRWLVHVRRRPRHLRKRISWHRGDRLLAQLGWAQASTNRTAQHLAACGSIRWALSLGWALGGANCAFNCIHSAGPSDLYVTGGAPYNGTSAGHVEGVNGWMVGSVTSWSSHPASVPEPGTLGLLGVGLLGASAARRKRAA